MSDEPFYKMCGSGNDFVFFDGREVDPASWSPGRMARICTRGTGVGADGLVFLSPGSVPGAVRFGFFNSDGSRGEMCGNGALCATRLSAMIGLVPAGSVVLETDAGVVRGSPDPQNGPRAEISLPDVVDVSFPAISAGKGEAAAGFAVVGVPHLVVLVEQLERVSILERGRELRSHPAVGPAGANVNFVARDPGGWAMRTFERGVEAETLACGTGAVACATVLASRGEAGLPWSVRSRSGAVLTVSGELRPGGGLGAPRLGGEARLIYRGKLGSDA